MNNSITHFEKSVNPSSARNYWKSKLSSWLLMGSKETGLYKHPISDLGTEKWAQANRNGYSFCIPVDLDFIYPEQYYIFENFPPPNFFVCNRENHRSHAVYLLEKGLYKNKFTTYKQIRMCESIQWAMVNALGSDKGYSGFAIKDPFNPRYEYVHIHSILFTFDELFRAFRADEYKRPKHFEDVAGLGRNCTLFEKLRHSAYKRWRAMDFTDADAFFSQNFLEAQELNAQFNTPLDYNDIKATVKSITNWTVLYITAEGLINRNRRKGCISGQVRAKKADERDDILLQLHNDGLSYNELARIYNVTKGCIQQRIRGVIERKGNILL
jgi:hypothetical protein